MSNKVADIDTTAAQPGKQYPVSWTGVSQPVATTPRYATSDEAAPAHVRIFNESGCGLDLISNAGRQDYIPSGGWPVYEVKPTETSFTLTVDTIIAGTSPNRIKAILYQPGEPVPPQPMLGNSPVSVGNTVNTGGTVGTANQVDFDATAINGEAVNSVEDTAAAGGAAPLVDVTRKNTTGGKQRFVMGSGECDINGDGSVTAPTFHGALAGNATSANSATSAGSANSVPASGVQPGSFPTGKYTATSPANGSGDPATVVLQNGDGSHYAALGVSKAGDNVNAAGTYVYDHLTNTFPILAGKVQLAASLASTSYSGSDHQGYPTTLDGLVIRSSSTFSGTGAGTYSHGAASGWLTPNFVGITSNQLNSTMTVGVDSVGSTTVHVNTAFAWPFYGFATRS